MRFLKDKYILAYLLLYTAALAVLVRYGHSVAEGVLGFLIFGVAFAALAWWLGRTANPLPVRVQPTQPELLAVLGCLVLIALYLVWGAETGNAALAASPRTLYTWKLAKKLAVFVAMPYLVLRFGFGRNWQDFGFMRQSFGELRRSHFRITFAMSSAVLLLNFFLGSAAAPLRRGELNTRQLLLGLPLCFLWLVLEVGLVEEFFFRTVLQARLAAWFRSETAGIVLAAVLFGLAHAPGFIWRQAGMIEALGAHPSIWEAAAYSIVVLSASGFFFGAVWVRTRNLLALMLIHAATDLLPGITEFVNIWGVR